MGVVMKNLFSFWGLLLCVAISLSVTACSDDKDDADDNRYEVGTNCDCADIVALLTNKIEEMEAQLEEYKSEIDSIETQLNIFSGGGQALPQVEKKLYEFQEIIEGKTYYEKFGFDFEYDDKGRLIKVIADDDPDINITYSENKCIIKQAFVAGFSKCTITIQDDKIDNPQAVNYLILDLIFNDYFN